MPTWPWNQGSASDSRMSLDEVRRVSDALYDAETPEELGRITSQYRSLVLSDAMLRAIQAAKDLSIARGVRGGPLHADTLTRFINTARARGIEAAVAEEKRRLGVLFEAMQDYFTAPMPETRAAFEKHRAILMSDEGAEYVRGSARQLREPENGAGQAAWEAKIKNSFMDLRVRFLDDARSRGVDYAERHFKEGLTEAVGQSIRGYRNALDPNLE